jgi:hypothetical protein
MKKGILITFDHKYKENGKLAQLVVKKCNNYRDPDRSDERPQFLDFTTMDGRTILYKTEDIFGIAEVQLSEDDKKKT